MSLAKDEKTIALEEIVPEYDSSFSLVKNLFWDRIKHSVMLGNIVDAERILDVGCGTGYLLREIRKRNSKCRLYGIDFNVNIKNLDIPGCELNVEDVRALSFEDNLFDIVYALDTLEHIKDVKQAIQQIKRVLKPSGKLIVSGPTESYFYKFCRFLIKGTFSEKEGPGTGVHHHTIYEIDKEVMNFGFVKQTNVNLPKFPLPILFKIIEYQKS